MCGGRAVVGYVWRGRAAVGCVWRERELQIRSEVATCRQVSKETQNSRKRDLIAAKETCRRVSVEREGGR